MYNSWLGSTKSRQFEKYLADLISARDIQTSFGQENTQRKLNRKL